MPLRLRPCSSLRRRERFLCNLSVLLFPPMFMPHCRSRSLTPLPVQTLLLLLLRSHVRFADPPVSAPSVSAHPDDDDDDDVVSVASNPPAVDKTIARFAAYIHDQFPDSRPFTAPSQAPHGFEVFYTVTDPPDSNRPLFHLYPLARRARPPPWRTFLFRNASSRIWAMPRFLCQSFRSTISWSPRVRTRPCSIKTFWRRCPAKSRKILLYLPLYPWLR